MPNIRSETVRPPFRPAPKRGSCYWTIVREPRAGSAAVSAATRRWEVRADAIPLHRAVGRALLEKSEQHIRQHGGRRVYIETSSRHDYAPTRTFYLRCDYQQEAVLKDFYAPGDDKVIYVKALE